MFFITIKGMNNNDGFHNKLAIIYCIKLIKLTLADETANQTKETSFPMICIF